MGDCSHEWIDITSVDDGYGELCGICGAQRRYGFIIGSWDLPSDLEWTPINEPSASDV